MRAIWFSFAVAAAIACFGTTEVSAATLDRIKSSGVVKLAYRVDAPPYSFKNKTGIPSGYTVDLCRAITASLKNQLESPDIKIEPFNAAGLTIEFGQVAARNRDIAVLVHHALICPG